MKLTTAEQEAGACKTNTFRSFIEPQKNAEEEEVKKQQKKRHAEVLESAKYYTEEDWDIIRANVESNTELSKILLGENEPGEDFATRMVNFPKSEK
ncbi:hypothetical protein Tco_0227552 [Tanacetum coccineum]